MRSAVTVSLVPEAKGGPFVFWNGLEDAFQRAAEYGFEGIEIFPPDSGGLADVGELIIRHHLQIAAVGTGGGWVRNNWHVCHAEASIRQQARAFIREIIAAAAGLAAPAILGSMQGRWDAGIPREQALEWLAEALREFDDYAGRLGQVFLYEPLNRYETNLFNRVGDAAAFLDQLNLSRVKILGDLFHMNIEEASIGDSLRALGSRLGHVHFSDSNRHAVGFGHTRIEGVSATLRDLQYTGFLSAEVLPLPGPDEAAIQTMKAFRKHFSK